MNENSKLLFIGTIKKIANCGESMKNHLFIERFREIFDKVITIDIFQPRKHPLSILKIIIFSIFYRKVPIALSVSPDTADKVIHLLHSLGRFNIYYWAVGGTLHEKLVKKEFDLDNYRKLKAIYVQSPKIVQGLKDLGINNAIHVNNSKRIDYLPDINYRANEIVKFVFLSRIHPDKGCNLIINCAIKLNNEGYSSKFVIDFYGKIDDCYDSFLLEISSAKNVNYNGFLDLTNKKGYDVLSGYDLMLFPTYWDGEGFPGIVIDAYIAGLPIIASNWNCNEEVITDKTGVIIPHHDEDALYHAMKNVLDGRYDLKAMSLTCQSIAMSYDNRNVLSEDELKRIGFLK